MSNPKYSALYAAKLLVAAGLIFLGAAALMFFGVLSAEVALLRAGTFASVGIFTLAIGWFMFRVASRKPGTAA